MTNHTLAGYTGAYQDPIVSGCFLGNGYRIYLPSLMRFASPDDWSPFREGGVNPYSYCEANPINNTDPTGHVFLPALLAIGSLSAVAAKFIGSGIADAVKPWIDGPLDEERISATTSISPAEEQAASSSTSARRIGGDAGVRPGQNIFDKDAEVKLTLQQRKAEEAANYVLNRASKSLTKSQKHYEKARLLHSGAKSSHESAVLLNLAKKEIKYGSKYLDSSQNTTRHLDKIEHYYQSNVSSELKSSLQTIRDEQLRLRHSYAELIASEAPGAQRF